MKVVRVNSLPGIKMPGKAIYLFMGFEELGIQLSYSEELKKEFFIRKEGTKGLLLFEIIFEDNSHVKFWFDVSASKKAYPSVVKDNKELYFKIQYHESHEKYPFIRPIAESVAVPWTYFDNLNFLRQEKLKKDYNYDIVGLFIELSRSRRRDHVEKILEQKGWRSFVSVFNRFKKRPTLSNTKGIKKLSYLEHLKLQAHSKISLSVPDSYKGYRCFRETEVLGFGGCLFLPEDKRYPDFSYDLPCWVYIKADLSDFVEKVNYYLQHNEEREEIAKRGLEYFEKYLSPKMAAKMIIDQCEKLK